MQWRLIVTSADTMKRVCVHSGQLQRTFWVLSASVLVEVWRWVICEMSTAVCSCVRRLTSLKKKKKNSSKFFCCLFLSGVTHPLTQNLFVSLVFLSVSSFSSYLLVSITNPVKYLKNSGSFELHKHGFLVEIYIGGCFFISWTLSSHSVSNSAPDGV